METNYIKSYLSSHPEASLKDYVDYLDSIEKEKRDKETERQNNERKYFESMIGKYFIINFNNSSYIVVYIDKLISGTRDKFKCYDIIIGQKFSIECEIREFNKFWFINNPYLPPVLGQACQWTKEISKEEYEAIVKQYEEITSIFNHIKSVLLTNN